MAFPLYPELSEYPLEALKAEIEERKLREQIPPEPLENPNFTHLKEACESYVNQIKCTGWADDDLEHFIFEASITAFYGKEVWKWINKHLR